MAREPGYCLHKPTGQAYVNLGGKVIYLGKHGSEESKLAYNRLKAKWLVSRHDRRFQNTNFSGPTMADVCLAYLDHADVYYGDGTELVNLKMAMRPVEKLYAKLPARMFGVVEFRAVREWWLTTPIDTSTMAHNRKPTTKPKRETKPPRFRTRQYINKQMKRLLRVVKWAVAAV